MSPKKKLEPIEINEVVSLGSDALEDTDAVDAQAEDNAEEAPDSAPVEEVAEQTRRTLIYHGTADVFRIRDRSIRPGKPFVISDDNALADELLTYPFERFEEVKE